MTSKLNRTSQSGFTLVELAIVLMIIGLLIGGILRGQELMENARVTSTIQQTKAYDGATTTFRDSYSAIPGDIANPGARLANCVAAPCNTAGNGDGLVGNPVPITGNVAGAGTENVRFWTHLASARLISGTNPTSTIVAAGEMLPIAKIAGVFHVIQINSPAVAPAPPISGLFLNLRNGAGGTLAEGPGLAAVSPNRAAQFDRKLDDGLPRTGDVIGLGDANCTGVNYTESVEQRNCNLLIRIQS